MINEKAIKAADLIDVSDKPPVSNFRVGILFMFFSLRNGRLLEETTAGKASVLF
jgi:hypothetical protein